MIELTQTSLHPAGNCWQTCVACILDLDPETMPPQSEYDWVRFNDGGEKVYGPNYNNPLQAYLYKHHGLAYCEVHVPDEALALLRVAPGTVHMLTGRTVRTDAQGGTRHVVVARAGAMIWDPHPSRAGLTDEIHLAFLVSYPKSWNTTRERVLGGCQCPSCKVPA